VRRRELCFGDWVVGMHSSRPFVQNKGLSQPACLVLALILFTVVCSCARRGVPPGGPVDTEPPRVVSSDPDSGQVAVGPLSEVCITFSEEMDRRTVRDVVTLRPGVKISDTDWRKNTFCVTLADSLSPTTTYTLTLMAGCRDAHGNATRVPYAFTFSSGDSIMAGGISGTVKAKTLPAPGIPVWAFDSLRTPQPDFAKDEPHYVSQAGPKGEFNLIGLPSGTYLIFAFKDKDANRAYDPGNDFASPAPAAVHVTPEKPVIADVEIALVDPNEPGGVRGVVHHCFAPDSVVIAVTAASTVDSSVSFSTSAGRDSSFAVGDMPPGRYVVTCFADINRNGTPDGGSEIESGEPHVILITPGEIVSDVKLELACPRPPTAETIEEGHK